MSSGKSLQQRSGIGEGEAGRLRPGVQVGCSLWRCLMFRAGPENPHSAREQMLQWTTSTALCRGDLNLCLTGVYSDLWFKKHMWRQNKEPKITHPLSLPCILRSVHAHRASGSPVPPHGSSSPQISSCCFSCLSRPGDQTWQEATLSSCTVSWETLSMVWCPD